MSEHKIVERVPDWQERFQRVIDARAKELRRIRAAKKVKVRLVNQAASA